ncbi:MAG: hypothetical protein M3N43_00190, partial [Actinomycetota bacterium]|nr:hypothetical protein [Actinomycetota bacterium]
MRRSYLPLLFASLTLGACAEDEIAPAAEELAPAAVRIVEGPEQMMPGELLVKFRPGADPRSVPGLAGARLVERVRGNIGVFLVPVGSERSRAVALRRDPNVTYAEPNYLRQPHAIDGRLWAFYNPGGLVMRYSKGKTAGQPLPSSYTSILDADQDNIEGFGAGGSPVVVG